MNFRLYWDDDLMGLPTDENHLVFQWNRDDCRVLFSAAQQGKAISIHVASDKQGLRHLRQAINEFSDFCFEFFKCPILIGKIGRKSILKIVLKIGWEIIYTSEDAWCVARRKS